MKFRRYALYFVPDRTLAWSKTASAWLGWDLSAGKPLAHPNVPGLPVPVEAITEIPRRYGLHATIKPPFVLAEGHDASALIDACEALCATLDPVQLDRLAVARMGRFLALRPVGDEGPLNTLAAACVAGLDRFRAPPPEDELARRRARGLSAAQEANLLRWGYPHVMDCFRFHITLTGRLKQADLTPVADALTGLLDSEFPRPFHLDALALAGEDAEGRFHLIRRFPLGGAGAAVSR